MADNEKLLEAARRIQRHCTDTEMGCACPLSRDGVCDGLDNCGVCGHVPDRWKLPKHCRWTENDMIMAKALLTIGFERVAKNESIEAIFTLKADGTTWLTPSGLFKSINAGETVNLSDIIAEYSEVTGHEV